MKSTRASMQLKQALSPRFTQTELAARLGVSKQAVHAWLQGTAKPSAEKMAQIEDLVGIPMRAWTEEAELDGPTGGAAA